MLYLIRDNDIVYTQTTLTLNKGPIWKKTIKLREPILQSEYITIIDIKSNKTHMPFDLTPQYTYNISILKSNIQKTMRRQMIDQCLATTLQLLKQDTQELLRRLPVIILEDSQYNHYTYTHLIWLLLAHSKGYKLTKEDVQLIMDATITALKADMRYDLELEPSIEELKKEKELESEPHLTTPYIVIKLRAIYGGLQGDQAFLNRLALRSSNLSQSTQYTVDLNTIETFNPILHIIPQAIDFHCCPYILDLIDPISQQVYKQAIWWNWSSINWRDITQEVKVYEARNREANKSTYNQIKRFLRDFAKKQIYGMLYKRKQVIKQKTIKDYFIPVV